MDMYDVLLARQLGASGGGGTTNYNALDNKPEINGETLQGDKDSTELKIAGKIANANFGEVFNNYSNNVASGAYSHAEGNSTTAIGNYSHAEGNNTKASSNAQHVQGKYNIEDSAGKYAFIIGNGTSNARSNALAVDWSGDIYPANYGKGVNLAQIDTDVAALRLALDAEVYGFRIDKQDSNPETRVEYLYDAVGMTPARMNYTTGQFDYGSWANAWFITGNKPCALKYDGTVDYYLDPDDYTKKADGTASDVSDSSYAGNFMASMPTVWIKRWEDERYQYVAIANKQISDDFKAYAHDAGDGFINDFIYLPMFKGVIVDGKLRSIAGVTPQGNTTGSDEKTAAETCGTGWQMWDWAKHELISDLLTLISRSTNSQAAFGQGDTNTYDETDTTTYGMLTTGTSGAGQFYGTNDQTHHVKVFHIEDFWGNRADTCLGLNVLNKRFSYKMVRPYALSPDSSYVSFESYAPDTGYQGEIYIGEFGILPKKTTGSATTYFCDKYYGVSLNDNRLAVIGGACNRRDEAGSRYLLPRLVNYNYTLFGASPCYNAPHSV